jgi:glycosyltransferase involved in cell wall biosynthesis
MWTDSRHDVILATHYQVVGPASALDEYLRERTHEYLYIAHPLFDDDGLEAYYERWQDGVRVERRHFPALRGARRFVGDVVRTVRWVGRGRRYELFVAGDNLLALAGLYLRLRRRVRWVALYTIDFVPRRFANPLLNRAYHAVDRFAASHVDVLWNAAEGIGRARRMRDGGRTSAPDIVVPVGARVDRIRALADGGRARDIIYLGHLLEKQGVQLVIEAMPRILALLPDTRFLVIGDGPHLEPLRSLASQTGVAGAVEFLGASVDHQMIEERLSACSVGVAPYVPDPSNYSQFTDLPGKVKNYLACGLAVVMTGVPGQAAAVEAAGAGRVIPYDPAAAANAIIAYLTDEELRLRASRAATAMAAPFDWTHIFDVAFQQTGPLLAAGRSGQGR